MQKLKREDLFTLERYAEERPAFRAKVMEHKKHRKLPIGPNATLLFEDRLTIQYQIQEMLRIERIFEAGGIQDELDTYNSLIPDGTNWKATLMLEFDDADERRIALARLNGIERDVWIVVDGFERVSPFADEDLERSTDEKTAAVHFLRFELSEPMRHALEQGASLAAGIDHEHYRYAVNPVPTVVRDALVADLI